MYCTCTNEKRKRCNRIPSDRTLGRNYPSADTSNSSRKKVKDLYHVTEKTNRKY